MTMSAYREPTSAPPRGDLLSRIPEAIERGVVAWIRQSSHKQREQNVGSGHAQADYLRLLVPFGVDPSQVRVIDGRGESGSVALEDRPMFQRLLDAVSHGEIGLVVVAYHDRASRDESHAALLYDACAANGVLLLIDGNFYDPADAGQRLILNIHASIAAFENYQRIIRMSAARCAQARRLAFPVHLPSGLVWASPDDDEYVRRLTDAGLAHHLEQLDTHRAVFELAGRRHYVLPYPDRDVFDSMVLRLDTLFRHRSIRALRHLVRHDPRWPRPGHVPVGLGRRFNVTTPLEWVDLDRGKPGVTPPGRAFLRDWCTSPALYGIYHFESATLSRHRAQRALGFQVDELDAFPSLRPSADYADALQILATVTRPDRRRRPDAPARHLLPNVRCGEFNARGTSCGRRLGTLEVHSGTARRIGGRLYVEHLNRDIGHQSRITAPYLEQPVLELITSLFTPERLRAAVQALRLRQSAEATTYRLLEREAETLQTKIAWAETNAFEAQQKKDARDDAYWQSRRKTFVAEYDACVERRAAAARRVEEEAEVTQAELAALMDTATTLPRYLHQAETAPAITRRLLAVVCRSVTIRKLGDATRLVEVAFPTGVRFRRVVFIRGFMCRPGAAAYAAACLAPWLDVDARFANVATAEEAAAAATAVAAELMRLDGPAHQDTPWTGERVWHAALQYHLAPVGSVVRPAVAGDVVPLERLAAKYDLALDAVQAAAVAGRLGAVRAVGGVLEMAPSWRELVAAFLPLGRREAAEAAGWSMEETRLLLELTAEAGWDYTRIRRVLPPARAGRVADTSNRLYARRIDTLGQAPLPPGLDWLDDRLPEELRHPEYWLTSREFRHLFPWAVTHRASRHLTHFRPGHGRNGRRSTFLWVPPEAATALLRQSKTGPRLRDRWFDPASLGVSAS